VIVAGTIAGCGGGGGDQQAGSSTPKQVTTQTRGSTTTTTQAATGAPAAAEKAKGGSGEGRPTGQSKSEHADNNVAIPKGSAKKSGGKKPKPPASTPNTVPPSSAKGIFSVAKGICSNPAMLAGVPEGIRDDDQAVAKYAEIFAPPGQEKAAHDGCLAGLKSSGR
jgi:hypothetical protein